MLMKKLKLQKKEKNRKKAIDFFAMMLYNKKACDEQAL